MYLSNSLDVTQEQASFQVQQIITNELDEDWHFHPELELVCVQKGTGKRFVGNSLSNFSEGEVYLLGPGLPHLWQGDKHRSTNGFQFVVVHFTKDFLGKDFFWKAELGQIKRLFEKAASGMVFRGKNIPEVSTQMENLLQLGGYERIKMLLDILDLLSTSSQFHTLTSKNFSNSYDEADQVRMNKVCRYVIENFKKEIRLEEVSEVANLTPAPFCRYFKKRTQKTFSRFLNEVRTGHACKLLAEQQTSISQIALECGYHSLTNFNRQFKKILGYSPVGYRKLYLQNEEVEVRGLMK
ncbi:AraC family transcriptional regulator [Flammeovirgaceae bacterium SG7u.111]|nr:AraC family transcriptional regulator [Flammeovirgaceae bacterium SG7u.132]WPO35299.1 AraC family transcriptional regulator [Flammeovirgaceae bacterium SG7u.111]